MTLADAQANVICGYGSDYAHYVFARIVDAQNARRWLADRLDRITYNASWGSDRPEHVRGEGHARWQLQERSVPGFPGRVGTRYGRPVAHG